MPKKSRRHPNRSKTKPQGAESSGVNTATGPTATTTAATASSASVASARGGVDGPRSTTSTGSTSTTTTRGSSTGRTTVAELNFACSPFCPSSRRCRHGLEGISSAEDLRRYMNAANDISNVGYSYLRTAKAGCFEALLERLTSSASQPYSDALPCSSLDTGRIIQTLVYMSVVMLLRTMSGDAVAHRLHAHEGEDLQQIYKEPYEIFKLARLTGDIILQLTSIHQLQTGTFSQEWPVTFSHERATLMDCDRGTVLFFLHRSKCNCLQPYVHLASQKEVDINCCHRTGCRVKAGELATQTQNPSAALFLCSGCKVTKYCSRECQRMDWPDHKRHCREMQEFQKTGKQGVLGTLGLGG